MRHFILIFFILLTGSTVAQVKSNTKTVQGTWFASKTIIDPKVGLIKLIRVGHDTFGHGTFIDFKDTTSFTMYYSPMCGNDCFWNYSGNYSVRSNKLSLKFNTYTQNGMCKSLTKSYNKTQMKFVFLVESVGKDTLVLKRQSK
ncbi:MAG: lipocalin family protein [Sphingobacteriaceae bacterium]|jgi:Lipocalin-like domain|nr:lipocalin family protein [Sphingobacteriaceae bacterium]